MNKTCKICNQEKSLDDFYRNSLSKDGRDTRCKLCMKEYGRNWERGRKLVFSPVPLDTKKVCSICHELKTINEFHKRKGRKIGIVSACKMCYRKIRMNKWRNDSNYKQKLQLYGVSYNKDHTQEKSEYNKKYSEVNKSKRAKRVANRMKKDFNFKIRVRLSGRIRSAVKQQGTEKSLKTIDLLSCSMSYFLKYIESLFLPGMTWNNYGKNGWVIDHIIPCASFDLTRSEEQKKCFHYSNLRPLWYKENLKKSSWVNGKLFRKGLTYP